MFVTFARTLYKKLVENEFYNIKNSSDNKLNDDTKVVSLIKQIGSVLYIVNIINIDKIENLLDYKAEIKQRASIIDAEHIIIINISASANISDIKADIDEEFMPNEKVHIIEWIVDLNNKELIVNQTDKILNIQELIKLSLNSEQSENILSDELQLDKLQKEIQINTALKPESNDTYFTFLLMIINIIIWAVLSFESRNTNKYEFLLKVGANSSEFVFQQKQYYRLLTSMFIHIDFLHLLSNCFALYLFGNRLEKYFGKTVFITTYIISGLYGSLMSVILSPYSISVGASGAIYGLIGAVLALTQKSKKKVDGLSLYIISIMLLLGLGFGFLNPQLDNYAHIGGLIAGYIIGLKYSKEIVENAG